LDLRAEKEIKAEITQHGFGCCCFLANPSFKLLAWLHQAHDSVYCPWNNRPYSASTCWDISYAEDREMSGPFRHNLRGFIDISIYAVSGILPWILCDVEKCRLLYLHRRQNKYLTAEQQQMK
jgi:hypothetical protein